MILSDPNFLANLWPNAVDSFQSILQQNVFLPPLFEELNLLTFPILYLTFPNINRMTEKEKTYS